MTKKEAPGKATQIVRSSEYSSYRAYHDALVRAGVRFIDAAAYDQFQWSPSQARLKAELEAELFSPWDLPMPGYVLASIAAAVDTESEHAARTKAQAAHLHAVAVGWIKTAESEPMPEEVKALLKERAATKRALKRDK